MQEHTYRGPRLAALEENLSQTDYIPNGTGKKSHSKYRKPPSKLTIYRDQFYEPMTDGVCGSGRSNHADPLDEYACLLDALHDPEADQDEDTGLEIDTEDGSTPWD